VTRIALLAVALAPLLGCGPSPEQKIELARRIVHSWTATIEKASEALHRGAVPRVFVRQIVEAAAESRKAEAASPEWKTIPGEDRAALDDGIRRLASLAGQPDSSAAR
jgi:hypothetical protein